MGLNTIADMVLKKASFRGIESPERGSIFSVLSAKISRRAGAKRSAL